MFRMSDIALHFISSSASNIFLMASRQEVYGFVSCPTMQREPSTLSRDISPPPARKASAKASDDHTEPSLAAIEAGQIEIQDHLEYFVKHLESASRPCPGRRLPIEDFRSLYERNAHEHGRHFVVHQHDHPISGVHYDLRLQFSESSSVSFAVPYGLPGNPNSSRPNRMAIETRVHNLWNNVIESASHATGSLLIWDTGEYEVLPWKDKTAPMTDNELSDEDLQQQARKLSDSERLFAAFKQRHIRLRLHGTKLPSNYTVSLRLPLNNDRASQPKRPKRKRRRLDPAKVVAKSAERQTDDSDSEAREDSTASQRAQAEDEAALASETEESTIIRANNAYTGADNIIGSIHQRHWFLTLDRKSSGFRKSSSTGRWEGSWEPFFVRGRDAERSVVTCRSADEVMEDEGVEKFVGRKMWRPILE